MYKFTCLLLMLTVTTCVQISEAVELPAGLAQSEYVTGLAGTTQMAFAPDGRLFVCEQKGTLRIVKDGVLLAQPFMTVPVNFDAERGLISVAFDPNFATNNYLYVFYTVPVTPVKNRVSRFTANGDLVVPGTEKILLEWDASRASYHQAGGLHFGTDGRLYISTGDNTNSNAAQSLSSLLGKILRINTDGTIPADNPFYATASGNNRAIWYYGFRNPYTFAIEKTSGLMIINDVGQDTWEEVNVGGPPGANYGWPTTEGPTNDSRFVSPAFTYQHDTGNPTGCSVIGGAFYNTDVRNLPDTYYGKYFFGDWCGGWIRTFDQPTGIVEVFATGLISYPTGPTDFDFGPDGALYYISSAQGPAGEGTGAIFRIAIAGNRPAITAQPVNKTVTVGQPVSFSVGASGSVPLAYQWQRNGVNIPGATLSSYTLASTTLGDNGAKFRAVVSNSFGSITSSEATLTVTSNVAPTPTIQTPVVGTLYTAGSAISYSGNATDPENGTLPASAFTWEVVFHHDTHTHPFIPATTGSKSGSFVIPTTGETASTVWYRIYLTVMDSGGLTTTVYRDILPRTANITLASNPPGLQVTLDGQPKTTPYTVTGVVGIIRELGLISPQSKDGIQYTFKSWSDGQTASHDISTPATNTTYTATFEASSRPVIAIESISPFIGTGRVQTFTAVYSSSRGWQTIGFAYFMVNVVVSPNNSCYVEYNRAANTLRLISNTATNWLGPITPGSAGTLQNSACTLNGPGSSASGSGNNLSVNFSITFRSTFVGKRGIFLSAQDNQGGSIDWSPYGAWWPDLTSGSLTDWYRLYGPPIHSHLYTTDLNEYNTLATWGFVQEGSSGRMFNAPASASGVAAIPLYRIYIAPSGGHFWTPDRNEYLTLIKARGYYVGEGVDGLLFGQQIVSTIPLYRLLYNFASPPIHHWTTDQNEYNTLRTQGDWTGEGITGYMYPSVGSTGLTEHVEVTSIGERVKAAPGERGKAALGEKGAAVDAGASGIIAVLNSGSKRPAPIVPGESIMLTGYGIGAEDADNLTVSIGGQPARVLDVSANHLRVVVPRAIAGRGEVMIEITANGRKYEPVSVELAAANPGIYVENPFGMGQAVIRNVDGTDNSTSNPAEKGSMVTLYITGEGDVHPVTVSIGGHPARVVDVTPSASEGRTAVRFIVPDVPETLYPLAIGLQAGEAMAQQGATIAVK